VNASAARSEEMARAMAEQNEQVTAQAAGITASSAAIEEMMANIKSIADNLERNDAEFSTLNKQTEIGKQELTKLKETVSALHERSAGVAEANRTIQSIAAQTNLLAMNAAIEAAHAGETGKGFSVVADEIRKLAESSASQSKVIAENVKGLRDCVEAAVTSTNTAEMTFEEIYASARKVIEIEGDIKNAVNEESEGGKQILAGIADVQNASDKVKKELRTLVEDCDAVQNAMAEASSTTGEVSNNAVIISEKVEDLKKQIDATTMSFTETDKNIGLIEERLKVFKTE
jgi:methyl-accepting chemotaxis protein